MESETRGKIKMQEYTFYVQNIENGYTKLIKVNADTWNEAHDKVESLDDGIYEVVEY